MLVFIDETGDHSLTKIDPQYPIFALGALIISEPEYSLVDTALREIKKVFFGDDGTFILHSSELKRPRHPHTDPRNAPMSDPVARATFYRSFDSTIVRGHDFSIAACFVRKIEMRERYAYPIDPYHFCFENIVNRVIRHSSGHATLYAERRGRELDNALTAEYERLRIVGTRFVRAEVIQSRTKLVLAPMQQNISGLQIVDLALSSLTRAALG